MIPSFDNLVVKTKIILIESMCIVVFDLLQFLLYFSGSSDPQPCPGGQYCQFDGLDTPTGNCSAGYYCSDRASSATPTDGSTGNVCPPGYYCISGSAWPTSCSPGTYSPSTGNTHVGDCLTCSYGEYCGDYNLTATSGNYIINV